MGTVRPMWRGHHGQGLDLAALSHHPSLPWQPSTPRPAAWHGEAVKAQRPRAYELAARRYLDGLLAQGVVAVPCSVCGRLVDLEQRGRSRDARSVEHTVPISKGGPMLETSLWRVAHYGCNSAKRDRVVKRQDLRPSRAW